MNVIDESGRAQALPNATHTIGQLNLAAPISGRFVRMLDFKPGESLADTINRQVLEEAAMGAPGTIRFWDLREVKGHALLIFEVER